MKTKTVKLSDIAAHPNMSLAPRDYIDREVFIAPAEWKKIRGCNGGEDCPYCQAIGKKTYKVTLDPQDEGVTILKGFVEITEDEYKYIKLKTGLK